MLVRRASNECAHYSINHEPSVTFRFERQVAVTFSGLKNNLPTMTITQYDKKLTIKIK